MPNVKLIVLRTGYAESGSMAMLPFYNGRVEFGTRMDALESLAHSLLRMWMDREEIYLEQESCCKEFLTRKTEKDKRCPQCGRLLDLYVPLEEFEEFVGNLVYKDADSWGLGLEEFNSPWTENVSIADIQNAGDEVLELAEYGERQVVAALRGDEVDHPAFKKAVEKFWENTSYFPGRESRDEFRRHIEGATSGGA